MVRAMTLNCTLSNTIAMDKYHYKISTAIKHTSSKNVLYCKLRVLCGNMSVQVPDFQQISQCGERC